MGRDEVTEIRLNGLVTILRLLRGSIIHLERFASGIQGKDLVVHV